MKQSGKYAVTGALAGFANGFFGTGGGLFLVPLLTRWAHMEQRSAFATSVAVVLPLSLASAAIYFFKGALDFSTCWPYLAGGFLGGLISGSIFKKVPLGFLRRAFGAFILYGGIRAVLAL
ncbi:sulfite exporter TauE/SafE family protein [bacterium D16-76]|nr:sulfite exporter TauE/SafE family protein [bacterium D16-76]